MIKLRKFLLEDLERVLEISRASFTQPWPKSEFEKYSEFFVAEEREKVAGFVVGKISEDIGQIKLIAVDPNYRGKGIGKKLAEFILNHFKNRGAKEALTRARTRNNVGISFLKNFGFEIIETIEKYYPDGDDAYLMKKTL